jgi:hypothetical protein
MNFAGTWDVIGLLDRKLVFLADGTGHFSVESERLPFFRWWVGPMTQMASKPHEPKYEVLECSTELLFAHAPFPFGIKHFRRVDQ